jgi:hypothetical protein
MPTRIYVNRKAIEANAQAMQAQTPCVRIDRDGNQEDCFGAEILGPSRVVYSPRLTYDGAHVWIETESNVLSIH